MEILNRLTPNNAIAKCSVIIKLKPLDLYRTVTSISTEEHPLIYVVSIGSVMGMALCVGVLSISVS